MLQKLTLRNKLVTLNTESMSSISITCYRSSKGANMKFPILFSSPIDPTDGTETLLGATDVFDGKIYAHFNPWYLRRFPFGAPSGRETAPTTLDTCSIPTQRLMSVFEGLQVPLAQLCLEQGQIVDYAKKNRDQILAEGIVTCCLVKTGKEIEWDTHIRREEGGYTFRFANIFIVGFGSLDDCGWEPRLPDGRMDYRVEAFYDDRYCEPWKLEGGRILIPHFEEVA
jgi:hypothetical protein